jgi:hypothetical protein
MLAFASLSSAGLRTYVPEATQRGSVLREVEDSHVPNCLMALYNADDEFIGTAFRLRDSIMTAEHVWNLLTPTFKVVGRELTTGQKLEKKDLEVEFLGVDRVRISAPRLLVVFAMLRIGAAKLGTPKANTDTYIFQNFANGWHESQGALYYTPEISSAFLLQHSCTTEPGASGAPLFQKKKVVGIHVGAKKGAKNVSAILCDLDIEWMKGLPKSEAYLKMLRPEAATYRTSSSSSPSQD